MDDLSATAPRATPFAAAKASFERAFASRLARSEGRIWVRLAATLASALACTPPPPDWVPRAVVDWDPRTDDPFVIGRAGLAIAADPSSEAAFREHLDRPWSEAMHVLRVVEAHTAVCDVGEGLRGAVLLWTGPPGDP